MNEVAQLLGVTPLTVRNWDKKGALVAFRNPMNNYRLYRIEDVESLLKQIESPRKSIPRATTAKEDTAEYEPPIRKLLIKDIQ